LSVTLPPNATGQIDNNYLSLTFASEYKIADSPPKIHAIHPARRPNIETKIRFLILKVAMPQRPPTKRTAAVAIIAVTIMSFLLRSGSNSSGIFALPNIFAEMDIKMPLMHIMIESTMTMLAGPLRPCPQGLTKAT